MNAQDGQSSLRLSIASVRFAPAGPDDAERGLLGWVSCVLNGTLQLDGIALRRTLRGELVLSFPAKYSRNGRQHAFVRPVDDGARRLLEGLIFEALGLKEGATP